MAKGKPPMLDLSTCEDKQESVELWLDQFNDWCILQDYRDTAKVPTGNAHWIADQYPSEISAFRLALPVPVWRMMKTTIVPTMTQDNNASTSQKYPWVWQKKLLDHYSGQDTVLSLRMTFMDTCKQKPNESIADFEARCKYHGSKCEYNKMVNPESELIRDRFITGIHNDKLRGDLLRHKKDDGTIVTLNEVINKAKAWEAAFKINAQVRESLHTEESVSYTQSKYTNRKQYMKKSNRSCGYCGASEQHARKICPAAKQGVICRNCYADNHFAVVCRNPKDLHKIKWQSKMKKQNQSQEVHILNNDNDSNESDTEISHEYGFALDMDKTSSDVKIKKMYATLSLSKDGDKFREFKFQVDTAASCNTMPFEMFQKMADISDLSTSKSLLHTYSGDIIKPLGKITTVCELPNTIDTIEFEIVDNRDIKNKPALLGINDSIKLGLIDFDKRRTVVLKDISSVQCELPLTKTILISKYEDVFKGIGNLGNPVSFKLDKNVTPVHAPVHRIPIAKRERTKKKLDEMVNSGKLTKVEEPTDWCSNMTVVEKVKPNGEIKTRLCIDPSQTVNKALIIPKYPIPTLTEILPEFSTRKYKTFTIVDALDGFTQVCLDDESSKVTTMHTPWGRYRWNRLPYGVSSGVEEFQKRIHEAIDGLSGVVGIADDLVVYGLGETQEEAEMNHDKNLCALMERAKERQLKLNPDKIQFKLKRISFMGFKITEAGVQPEPSRVQAITEMPEPKSKLEVQRFIGMVNYLNTFCPSLAKVISPLHMLTRQDSVFMWSTVHEKAFKEAKALITSAPCLAFFNVKKPVVLQVDASDYALGGSLLQPEEENATKLKPVAYTSCLMRQNELNWAQIEKETLAICAACEKWDLWLYGKKVTIHTDHQPLETIFKKPLSKAPKRLQKLLMRLQRYSLEVIYKKGSSLVLADTLSRAPMNKINNTKNTSFEIFRISVERSDNLLENKALTSKTTKALQLAVKEDPIMHSLAEVICNGWPDNKRLIPDGLSPFWGYRDEMSLNNGMVYRGNQVVIPFSMQTDMLKKIHSSHLGAESNIRLCKDILFWPGMQSDIKDQCSTCGKCAQYCMENKRQPMMSQPIPEYAWQFVSQDLCQFEGKQILVTVDHFSDFIEVDELDNTLSTTIIKKSKAQFSRHGIPEILLTDNGPQFISADFEKFCNDFKIDHITSSPYWPKGNGKAEAAVKIIKTMLKKADDLQLALLLYRNTPNQGHTLSPAQRSMNRHTRSTLPIMKSLLKSDMSSAVHEQIINKRQKAKNYYDRNIKDPSMEININDYVYAKPNPQNKGKPWLYGQVVGIPAPRSYMVETPNGKVRRNQNQLHLSTVPPSYSSNSDDLSYEVIEEQCSIPSAIDYEQDKAQKADTANEEVPDIINNDFGNTSGLVPANMKDTPDKITEKFSKDSKEDKSNIYSRYGRKIVPKEIFDNS